MKVALIADLKSLARGTGIERYNHELCNGLRGRGVDVSVVHCDPLRTPFGEAITHVLKLPLRVLRTAADFDLVHATAPVTGLSFPFVRRPKVVTYHDLISQLLHSSDNSFHARLFAPAFFRVGRWSDRVIADSSQTKDEITAHLGFPEEKLSVINLGVGPEFRPLRRPNSVVFSIGYVGTLAPRKRLDYLIDAFHRLKKTHSDIKVKLLIYGHKAFAYPHLMKQVEALHLEHDVEFKGFVSQEKLVEAYNSLDVFVLTSEWEGFGLPILEAQRCEVPVVIREGAHIPREVAKCALKTKSEADTADTIYDLLTNPTLRERVVKDGVRHGSQFTWENTVSETIRVYEQAVE
jgi:glycosyltransferase involved in cell wall biosynthesis